MGRAPCCDKANVKRGPWSPEEDATLKNYLERHGTGGNWIALPRKAGLKRCGKSCRLRWLNYLRPDIKHGGFTEEEDHIICTLYKAIGSKWSVIASHLQGRTDNDVKNYWNTKLKKKLFASFVPSPAIPTIKTESIPSQSFSMPPISSSFAANYNGYFVSPSVEDITIPNKIVHDDGFLMDMGFGSYSDIFSFYGLEERINGEMNTTSHGSSLLPSQGVYQNLTY